MSSGVRELRVWQESVSLAGDVIRAIRRNVRRETKSVSDHVMATAIVRRRQHRRWVRAAHACPTSCHPTSGQTRPAPPRDRARRRPTCRADTGRRLHRARLARSNSGRADLLARATSSTSRRQLAEPEVPRSRGQRASAASAPGCAGALRESVDEVDRAQPRAREAGFIPTTRCAVLERCDELREVQHRGDVAHVVPRILRQLRGRDQAHEVDHALEVRRPLAANVRLRCSRVTPMASASNCVRTAGPTTRRCIATRRAERACRARGLQAARRARR